MLRTLPRALPRARLAQIPRTSFAFKGIRSYASPAATVAPSPRDNFASGANQGYIEE